MNFLTVPPRLVDPCFDYLHLAGSELLNRLARVGMGDDQVRRVPHVVRFDFIFRREPAAGREKTRDSGMLPGFHLVAQLERQLAEIRAEGHARGHAVVGEARHVVEYVLARVILRPAREVVHVADMRMDIDQRRNHGFPRKIDARRIGGNLQLAAPAHADEAVALDDEDGVLDRTAVAGDEPRPFVHRHAARARPFHLRNAGREQHTSRDGHTNSFHATHGKLQSGNEGKFNSAGTPG